ncbi:phage tail length tape measure family protein [Sphingomonas sp. 3-13AW]|uniref:phage tail length tape measure family protein n=1 Tax=Sphingomonas sp. 3-13AW TaxID=3050450 RepID=UPI003BB7680B
MEKSVSIRMGTTGKADVTRTFDEIAASGDASAKRWSKAYQRAGEEAEAAIQRQANAAAKIAAITPQSAVQMRIADANGTGFGQWEGSARQSAAAFKELIAAEEQLDVRTRALVSAIDPAFAAQQRYNAEIREAAALHDAGRITLDQFVQAEAQAAAILEKVAGATRTAATETAELTAVQARVEAAAGTGFGQWEGSAKRSAQAMSELLTVEEQLDARTRALVASIDPAAAAQQRFNAEMEDARDLVSKGRISLDQYVAKLGQERAALDTATAAQQRNANSAGAQRAAMQGLSFQAQDLFTQLSMGANPLSVLAIQGGQAAGQFANLEGKAGSFARFMIGPYGLAITGGMLLLGALTDHLLKNNDASEKAEAGMKKFQDRQSDIGNFIDSTTGKLKEQNRTLVLNAILTRQAQIAANEKAVTDARAKAFDRAADATLRTTRAAPGSTTSGVSFEDDVDVQRVIRAAGGDVAKLADGLAALAKTRPELARVALDVSGIGGQAIIATRENADLQKELRALRGDTTALANADTSLLEARAKLAGATTTLDRAQAQYQIRIKEADAAYEASGKTHADQAKLLEARTAAERDLNVAQDASRRSGDRRAESLGRQAEAMEVNAEASLDLAKAYLVGGAAALRAEAARKGLTDATRRGIDTDAQVARQLQVMVGEQVASGAKSVAQLREETEARAAVRAQVLAGTLPAQDMARALSDEAALRPLLKLQTVAQGEALAQLTTVIEAYRKALAEMHEEEANSGAVKATDAAKARFAETISSIYDLAKDPLSRAMDSARRAAETEADNQGYKGEERKRFVDARVDESWASEAKRRAEYYAGTVEDQRDSLQLAQLELAMSAANDNERGRQAEKLRLILDLKRQGIDADSTEGREILANHERLDGLYNQAKLAAAGFQELRDFGSDFVDTVLSEDTWSSWGNAGKTILNMLKSEFIKLALLNPIKNLLNGDKALPTLTSAIGNIGKLFGSKGVGNNAAGTEWWSGGATWLAENGPEIVNLPQGSRVTSAGETRRLLGGAGGMPGGEMKLKLELTPSPYFDARVSSVAGPMVAQGAEVAAAGGAAMAEANDMAAGARRLGRGWR